MTALDRGARILVVGGGKMGEAILGGWIASEDGVAASVDASNVTVVNPGVARRGASDIALRRDVHCRRKRGRAADIVVLAVKPQVMPSVLDDIRDVAAYAVAEAGPLFISIAAGLTTEWFAERLPAGARASSASCPTRPCLWVRARRRFARLRGANAADVDLVCELFDALGSAFVVDELLMDATGPCQVPSRLRCAYDRGSARCGA